MAPPPPAAEPEPEPEPVESELRLAMSFQMETWVQVFVDEELQLDAIKQPGEGYEVTARESLRINTGNAGGFTFTLNGQPARALGPPGSVRNGTLITLENYREFLEED